MEYIKTLTDEDIFKYPEFKKPDNFQKRTTVKAVVINDEGKFGFVTNPVHGFYLLSGGGAESDNLEQEIKRECEEEINFNVQVVKKIAAIHEYRNREIKEYNTICFLVKTLDQSLQDTRADDEKKNDLQVVWLNEKDALQKLAGQVEKVESGEVKFYNTAFNIIRDNLFFAEYLKSL